MKLVDIEVYPIARSMMIMEGLPPWLTRLGAPDYVKELSDPEADLTHSEGIIGVAAKRCYMSFQPGLNPNVTKVRKDWTDYFNNILGSGHGSVLEHATWTFAIEGVSRVFTGEMNRHRAGVAISEGSMRYIRFDDIPFWMPQSLNVGENETDAILAKQKLDTQAIFVDVFQMVERRYKELVKLWDIDNMKDFHQKKQITSCLRRIIPMGVATGGVWTMNLRALRHIIALRTSAGAEEEIALVFSKIAKIMCTHEPRIFGDFEQTPEGCWVPKNAKV